MSAAWITIGVLALATAAIKAAGPVVLGGRPLPPRVTAVVVLLAPAILAALVVTEAFATGRSLAIDERAAIERRYGDTERGFGEAVDRQLRGAAETVAGKTLFETLERLRIDGFRTV